ncbi:exodeoxyribonuclease VII large subunit, partial [uncultured Anaerococcus sp.]|uniref:exodeoxyribonuclease VII large subunit n=1 Tax=uncultured Anaerococcus sp. TaxID=293428 RepID=UPI00260BD8A3
PVLGRRQRQMCIRDSNNSHLYFSLKEDKEVIDCVIYYFEEKNIDFDFSEGIKVNIKGNIFYNNYSSRILISVNEIYEVGLSKAYLKFLEMKEKFRKLGYFDIENKKDIPKFPKKIGLITSQDGAAIVDFISVINQKPNDIHIFLKPVKVQGLDSYAMVEDAIYDLDDRNLDLIVITRGGGSGEDLSTFNNKEIIEACFKAKTPIISAIGHKIDQTLLDLVSDLSLQTPTEAGSYVIRNYANIEIDIIGKLSEMKQIILSKISDLERKLLLEEQLLRNRSPINRVNERILELNFLKKDLDNKINRNYSLSEHKFKELGFNIAKYRDLIEFKKRNIAIKNEKNIDIYSSKSLSLGDFITVEFSDGSVKAEIID